MNPEVADLQTECLQTKDLLDQMSQQAFAEPTGFKGWTTNDILRHLTSGNRGAATSLTDPDAFTAQMARVRAERDAGASMREQEKAGVDGAAGAALAALWMQSVQTLIDTFGEADLSKRVPWGGKLMSARSSISARLMEHWAHAQAIYDLMGVARREDDRIRGIAVLGVNTYGWTFENRGETPPGPAPQVRLVAPSGAVWAFNEANSDSWVRGEAVEFCRVVAQTRNVRDTDLQAHGEAAILWMEKAQCFAGPPHDPPAPGTRRMAPEPRNDLLKAKAEGVGA